MKPVIIIAIAFVLLIPLSVLAQSPGVSITATAEQGSKLIIVTGNANPDIISIIFTIKTPSDDRIVAVEMAWLDSNGEFVTEINVGSLWNENGFYKIYADTGDPLYDLEISVEIIDGLTSETNITESNLETGLSTPSNPTVFSPESLDDEVITQQVKPIQMELDEISVDKISEHEISIKIAFKISNPNPGAVIVQTMDYQLFETNYSEDEQIAGSEIGSRPEGTVEFGSDYYVLLGNNSIILKDTIVLKGSENTPDLWDILRYDNQTWRVTGDVFYNLGSITSGQENKLHFELIEPSTSTSETKETDICSSSALVELMGPMSNINFKYKIGFAKLFTEYKTSKGFEDNLKEIDYKKSERATAYVNSIMSSEEFAEFYSERNMIPEEEKFMIQISEKYLEFLYDGENKLSSYIKTDYSEKKNEIDAIPMQDSRLTICGFDKSEALEELEEARDMQKSGIRQIVDPLIEDWEENLELKQSKFPTEFPKEESILAKNNIITGEIGLKKGDWVKYKVGVDGDGLFGMIDMMKSSYELPDSDCTFSEIDWHKTEIIGMNNNYPTTKNTLFCNGEEHTMVISTFDFLQHFIPIDVKIGDILTDGDKEYEVVGFETKYFDGKNTEVIKLYSEQIEFYDNDGKSKITDESFFEKNSGILLEKSMSMEMTNVPFLGDMSMSMTFDAIDYSTPRTILSQSSGDSGGGCLIATATYGSELAPQVQQLRELRDNSLLQTESGTSFMKSFNDFYYSFSPIIADYERENPVFREAIKIAITPMISSLTILNYVDMDSEQSVLGFGISLILLNIGMYVGIPAVVIIGIRKKF